MKRLSQTQQPMSIYNYIGGLGLYSFTRTDNFFQHRAIRDSKQEITQCHDNKIYTFNRLDR
jgi:hypothetical protein